LFEALKQVVTRGSSIEGMEEYINPYKVLVEIPEGKKPLGYQGVDGRITLRCILKK
jgi:hypothetical protein